MKSFKLKLSTSIMSLTLLSSVAIAQNAKTEMHQATPAQNQYNWTGFYGGPLIPHLIFGITL